VKEWQRKRNRRLRGREKTAERKRFGRKKKETGTVVAEDAADGSETDCSRKDCSGKDVVRRNMKRILTVSEVLKAKYGVKVYRLSLQSGCTCPNRDGTVGTGGCTFCSAGGSGDFAAPMLPVEEQIRLARKLVDGKIPASVPMERRKYIAYFQSYTNTYGNTAYLENLFREALMRPEIVILSVGTRPDCLEDEKIDMLRRLQEESGKPVWVELGLQTIHERTAARIRRGYPLPVFEDAVRRLKAAGLTVIVHVILGLPGESREDMLDTVRYLAGLGRDRTDCGDGEAREQVFSEHDGQDEKKAAEHGGRPAQGRIDGIKLQMLHILKGTRMAEEYEADPFPVMSLDEYSDLIADCVRILPEHMVIHRLTGDGPKRFLIAPLWSADKKRVLNTIRRKLQQVQQGRLHH